MNPHETVVRYITLDGQKSPGIATITGGGPPPKWNERSGYGLSGATLVFTGLGLAEFTVSLELYELNAEGKSDWEEWESWSKLLAPPEPGRRAKARDVWHPFLAALKVRSCVIDGPIPIPEEVTDGVWGVQIKFKQYRRLKMNLAKPEGSTATPQDPVDQRIEALSKQFQELANG